MRSAIYYEAVARGGCCPTGAKNPMCEFVPRRGCLMSFRPIGRCFIIFGPGGRMGHGNGYTTICGMKCARNKDAKPAQVPG
jgi:hypothetical protein